MPAFHYTAHRMASQPISYNATPTKGWLLCNPLAAGAKWPNTSGLRQWGLDQHEAHVVEERTPVADSWFVTLGIQQTEAGSR
jgi:hypothetical protein